MNEILNYLKEDNNQSTTPLIIAARNGHEEVINVLLIFGVDIHQKGTVNTDEDIHKDVTALYLHFYCNRPR